MIGSRQRAALMLGAALVVGALVGVGATVAWEHGAHANTVRGPAAYLAWLTDELKLDQQEQTRVKTVLDRYAPISDSMWEEVRPRFDSLRLALRADIRDLLRPDQQTQFQEMLRRHDAERHTRGTTRARK